MTDVLRGQDYVFEVEDPAVVDTFFLIAGQSTTSMTITKTPVKVSNKDTPDNAQRLGANMGEYMAAVEADGMLTGDLAEAFMLAAVQSGLIFRAQVRNLTTGIALRGSYLIKTLNHSGAHQADMKYKYNMDSDGPMETLTGLTEPAVPLGL